MARRLPARHAAWVLPLLLTLIMTGVVSLISTFKALGPLPHFAQAWLAAWGWSWLVAFPVVLVVLPLVRRLTAVIVDVRAP